MADTTHAGEHHGAKFNTYMVIAGILAVCTITSFFFNGLAQGDDPTISKFTSFVLILSVAILKATLVGLVFMHLKWDWRLVYFVLVPVTIMAAMMAVVLLPDTLLGPNRDAAEALEIAADPRLQ